MADEKKTRGRPFAAGTSGNPGGRPKAHPEMRELARSLTGEALATLADLMRSGPPNVRMAAADSLLNRAWGKSDSTREPYDYPAGTIFGEEDLARIAETAKCDACGDPRFYTATPHKAGGWEVRCECRAASCEVPARTDLEPLPLKEDLLTTLGLRR